MLPDSGSQARHADALTVAHQKAGAGRFDDFLALCRQVAEALPDELNAQLTLAPKELLRLHRKTYRAFWTWPDAAADYATIHRKLWTVFGWTLHVQGRANTHSLRNFPMQANGAEMLRLACIGATRAGIRLIAPVHDAVLIEAPLDGLEAATQAMQAIMRQASRAVLGGFELRSDVKTVVSPARYYEDERGTEMWQTVMALLQDIHNEETNHAHPA